MWEELGIEPTTDVKAIRRAYAQRLRSLDPDRDVEGFQKLRRAFETAVALAAQADRRNRRGAGERGPPSRPAEHPARQPPAPRSILETPPGRVAAVPDFSAEVAAVLAALDDALRAGDARQALARFDAAMAKGYLPLKIDRSLVERVVNLVLDDRSLPPDALQRVMRQTGLDGLAGRARWDASPTLQRAFAALEAEAWYARLLAEAERYWWKPMQWQRDIARAMLGRTHLAMMAFPEPLKTQLRAALAEYDRHKPWLEGRFDPARIERLRARSKAKPGAQLISGKSRFRNYVISAVFILAGLSLLHDCALSWEAKRDQPLHGVTEETR